MREQRFEPSEQDGGKWIVTRLLKDGGKVTRTPFASGLSKAIAEKLAAALNMVKDKLDI